MRKQTRRNTLPRKLAILPPLFTVVALGLVLAFGLWPSGQADASTHSGTRTLSAPSVAPGDEITVAAGGEITVTIRASGYGGFGQVVETLPPGFSYVDDSTEPADIRTSVTGTSVTGQDVRFTLLGAVPTFSYRVLASDTPDDYSLVGTLSNEHGESEDITPDSNVTVTAAVTEPEPATTPTATPVPPAPSSASATRSMPSRAGPGAELTVTIRASGYGDFGQVVETLPPGFSYVDDSTDPATIRTSVTGTSVTGQDITFTLLGANVSFSYDVTAASSGGTHTFSGNLIDDQGNPHTILDSSVNVDAPVTGATRRLPGRVNPGAELTVSIRASNYGDFGQVVETLPAGFSYVDDSTDPATIRTSVTGTSVTGQDITFTLLGANVSFSYDVTAASSGGTHTFSGNLIDDQGNPHTIRDSSVNVDAPVTGATRRLPGRVNPGAELTVSIRASNYGDFGQVVETLPAGFSYVDDSTDPATIRTSVTGTSVTGQDITFTLLGANVSFSYDVTAASSGGTHTFSGNLIDDQGNPHTILDSSVNVDAPVTGATRRLPGRVNPGAELTVSIRASNYGDFGQVVETLPAGFSYVDDSTDPATIRTSVTGTSVTGQDITFTLLGADVSFSYKAMATSTQATYTFEGGKLIDDQGNPHMIRDSNIIVARPTTVRPTQPTATATATPRPSTGGGGGSTRRDPTSTPTPRPATATPVPTSTPTAETGTATPTPTPTPTATPTPTPTPTAVPAPVATPTPSPRLPSTGDTLPLWLVPLAILGLLLAIGGALLVANQLLRPKDPRPGHGKGLRG